MPDEEAARLTLYRALPGVRELPADRASGGFLPTRAFRYCEPVTAASGLGWYLFLPALLHFWWDGGTTIRWWCDEEPMGELTHAQFPNFPLLFDHAAPASVRGYAPPWISISPHEPGTLQLWTGYLARTTPGWSTLIRPPVNLPRSVGYELYEGLVETDIWFGPLFLALRLTLTRRRVRVTHALPFVQLQLVPRVAYPPHPMRVVPSLADWTPEDWARYDATVVITNANPQRGRGEYAVAVRQRRHRERSP